MIKEGLPSLPDSLPQPAVGSEYVRQDGSLCRL